MLNEIIQGDCLEKLKDIPDNSIDLVVTSPPYDDIRDYKGYSFNFEGIAKELFRVTKKGGVVVWVVGDTVVKGSETGTSFKQALFFKEVGFNLHDTMIYQRAGSSLPDPTRYFQSFQYMFVLSKGRPNTINKIYDVKNRYGKDYTHTNQTVREKDGKCYPRRNREGNEYSYRGNIWRYLAGYNLTTTDKYAFEHPAMFPEKLAEDHIISWSNEGDVVLDPFAGSGTTLKMAKKLNRNYIGIEISAEYIKIIHKRLGYVEERYS